MCEHRALFYDDIYPAEQVSEFFAEGLRAGDSCLALLTAPNRRAVERGLLARGVRLQDAAYVAIDTHAVLLQCRVDGRLDMHRASDMLAPLMQPPPGPGGRRVRAAGDLAPTLSAAGDTDGAVAFESLVHRLAQQHRASVVCAYPMQSFGRSDDMGALLRLSAEHATVGFPERLWVQHLMPRQPRLSAA
jgi:hypothetical protein